MPSWWVGGSTGSGTRLAAGLHSIADTGTIRVALLLGLNQAKTPPITLQYGDDVIALVKAQLRVTAPPHTMLININRHGDELAMAFPQVAWLFFEPEPEDSIAPRPSTPSTA
ncbi:MAG TPA: hypothetical protein DCQ77_10465 [Betaproteobacteria bacterium]|nr:hypothetical protein [Betaproteobacteria bacterium]